MVLYSDLIKKQALSLGFHLVGIARVGSSSSELAAQRLRDWLAQGYHANLTWMDNPQRQNIEQVMEGVKSVISVALNYYTPHQHDQGTEYGKISRYGWGRDYHKVLGKKLKALAGWLEAQEVGVKTRYYVDTGPIAEKFWAQEAGIGWIAKNGNVISREYGSWIFLGEVLINVELTPDTPHLPHCGTCTRCIEACPTGAIAQPLVVDANRCIAYHTIENREPTLPTEISSNLGGWVAGCDICQEVCPWNERFSKETDHDEFQPYPENIVPKLSDLAQITEQEWDTRFRGSALRRIKPAMWQRNAKSNL